MTEDNSKFITALNSIESQPWAFLILIVGCVFLCVCKKLGEDTNIASGIVGCAITMFTGQIKQAINAQHVNTVNQPPEQGK